VDRHPGRFGITDSGHKSGSVAIASVKFTISKLPNFLFFRFKGRKSPVRLNRPILRPEVLFFDNLLIPCALRSIHCPDGLASGMAAPNKRISGHIRNPDNKVPVFPELPVSGQQPRYQSHASARWMPGYDLSVWNCTRA